MGDYATSKVTVIRNVVPNCMPDNNWIATDERKESGVNGAGGASEQGLAFAVNDVVSLVRPDYSTVQMRDAVTKMAGLDLRGGATLADVLVDSGSCGVDTLINEANDNKGDYLADVNTLMVADRTDANFNKLVYKTAMDATAGGGNDYVVNRFRVGMYIRIGADAAREYMLVTDVAQTALHAAAAGKGVLTVIRNVRPPCLHDKSAAPVGHLADAMIFKVERPGCFRDHEEANADRSNAGNKVTALTKALKVGQNYVEVGATTACEVGGYIRIGTEYMLITNVDDSAKTLVVVRDQDPPCLIGKALTADTAANADVFVLGANGDGVAARTAPRRSNRMISTSMRAVVELSPREPIVWGTVAPALPPSAFYVDVKVGIEYSEAEFATKSAAFTRAMSALTGVAVESTMVSYSAARRASGNVNARSYVLSQAEVTALLKKLGADTDTCTCGSSCQQALLDALNEKLVAEGLKKATSAEIVFNDQCKPSKKKDDNLLLLLLLLLLIPIAAVVLV